ncbi:MAG TPA: DUF4440 domain-containing protein [Gemmatimonadaceae bacterium]|jgi:ketosteroid isomerase-like protein|nr:DUF4440 domain-containing protein [Gemmatimonadaceae bacterium]
MRTHGRTLGSIVGLLLVAASCSGRGVGRGATSAREGIAAAYKTMEKAFQQGNTAMIAAAYTEDAEWYAPEAPVIKGPSAIGRAWQDAAGAAAGNRLRFDVAEVEQDGDRADEIGRFTISAPDGDVLTAGKYIVVWAQQSDGTWKARRGMFNWDIPPGRAETNVR